MAIMQVQGVCLSFGDRTLLDDVSFVLGDHARAALAGGNGEGKSTLMKIVAGLISSDGGQITKTKNTKTAYLPQSDIVLKDNCVYDEISADIDQNLIDMGFVNKDAVVYRIAQGLGLSKNDLRRSCSEFSGGYQMRIALARVLAQDPDFMMLDEPTNYLDIEARTWLKNYIRGYRGSLMIVCHDKGFMDDTVNEVYELFNGKLTRYSGNYSFYEKQRKTEIEQLQAAYEKQSAEIEKTQQFIERFRYKATKAKQVQSRIKGLEKIERVVVPSHLKSLHFSFPPSPHSPNDVAVINNMSKSYGNIKVFEDFSLMVNKGQRLAVTGHNGAGKSTLLRIIAQQDNAFTGQAKLGSGVKTGYYAQDTADSLDMKKTVLEEVLPYGTESKIRNALGSFLFSGDDIYKSVSVLSGGERSRLALLKILLQPASLLILDEPTNHLDINAKDMLLNALEKYDGTIIFVSHDAYFIKALATSILYLSEEKPQLINGDYDYFEYRMSQKFGFDKSSDSAREKPDVKKQNEEFKASFDFAADRAQANRRRNQIQKLRREIQVLMEEIDDIEMQIAQTNALMNLPGNYSDTAKITSLANQKAELENRKSAAEEKWLSKSEELGEYDEI